MQVQRSRPTSGASCQAIGILLAGGHGMRMETRKDTVQLAGRPLASWAAAALFAATGRAYQVGGAPLPGLDWPVWADARPGAGPAGGIESGLQHAGGAPVLVCALDMPLVNAALLRHALRQVTCSAAPAAAPHWGGRWHPLCAAYAESMLPTLQRWLDDGRHNLHGLLDAAGAVALREPVLRAFGEPAVLLSNINNPTELRRAERLVRQRVVTD